MDRRYQVMPALSAEEYAALKADIVEHGVLVPVEYDDEANILDGFHRVQICQELGFDWPKVVRKDLTDAQKLEHAWTLNMARRHLSREQKQSIAIRLRRDGWTQERIAQTLSVSPATISMWLTEFINSDELAAPTHIAGKDGKRYPTRKARQSLKLRSEKADKTGSTDDISSVSAHEPNSSAQSASLGEIVPTLSSTEMLAPMTVAEQPPGEPDTRHDAIKNRPKTLTEAAGSPTTPNGLNPHHEALDPPAGYWFALIGEIYAAFRSMEDQQDVITITQSWSQQTTAKYVHQCAYVISKLQAMLQTLYTTPVNEEPSQGTKESGRKAEPPHGDVGAPNEPAGEELNRRPLALEGAVAASTIALEERREKADDGLSASMYTEENNPRSLSRDPSHNAYPLFTVHEMTTPASDADMGTSQPIIAVYEEMTRTDGRARDHRQDVIERLNTLRAEKRSFRDIAATLNAEGVATFTGQGRWHHGMLPRLLHAIKANDQTP